MITLNEHEFIDGFKAKNALENIARLTAIPDRFAGRPGDVEAARFMDSFYRELGLETELFPVKVPSFTNNGVSLTLADGTEICPQPVYLCHPAPAGGVDADMVYVGSGEEEDYEGVDVAGKLVVIDTPRLYLGKYIRYAALRSAAALIVINPMAWPFGMGSEAGFADPNRQFYDEVIPAVCVSALDGLKIMYNLGAGKTKAHFVCDTDISLRETYIAVGIHRGTELPDETVGIIAHRDVVVDPGANDNGSGTGVMMELAKLMSKRKYKRTMLFISSTGEEGVTWGSYLYTMAKKNELKNMKALYNLDMFAVGGKLNLVDRGYWPDTGWMTHSEKLNRQLMDIADELGYDVGLMEADWGVSESDRFQSLGVPSIWFWKDGDPNYHTPRDVLENVDGNSLKVVGDLIGISADRVLNS